jgi:hypothetical protein
MSGRQVMRFVLCCDGCGKERTEAASAIEARASAYADGWRFPARARTNGSASPKASDVCPPCLPGWETRPAGNGQPANRLSKEEAA